METSLPVELQPTTDWLGKRKRTMVAFLLELFLLGVEYSVFFLTLWVYVETLISTNHPKVIYSLAASAYLFTAVLLSMVIGSIVDKSRDIRTSFHVCNCLVIIGNIIYTINLSPLCLIVGRLIAGSGGPLKSVIAGEVARSFPAGEVSSQFAKTGLAFSLGFVIGPALNTLFNRIDFSFFAWHITTANVAGLYMACLFIIQEVIVIFNVKNLSLEYDLKRVYEKRDTEVINDLNKDNRITRNSKHYATFQNESADSIVSVNSEKSTLVILKMNTKDETTKLLATEKGLFSIVKRLFSNIDCLIVFLLSYLFMHGMVTCDLWFPMIVIDVLKWKLLHLNILIFDSAVLSGIGLIIMIFKPPTSNCLHLLMVVSIMSMIIMPIILYCIELYKLNTGVTIALWCVFMLFFTIVCIMEEVYLVTTLSRMIPSSQQTFCESIRLGFARFGSLTALLTSAYLFEYLTFYACAVCGVWVIVFVVFLTRSTRLKNPKHIF